MKFFHRIRSKLKIFTDLIKFSKWNFSPNPFKNENFHGSDKIFKMKKISRIWFLSFPFWFVYLDFWIQMGSYHFGEVFQNESWKSSPIRLLFSPFWFVNSNYWIQTKRNHFGNFFQNEIFWSNPFKLEKFHGSDFCSFHLNLFI